MYVNFISVAFMHLVNLFIRSFFMARPAPSLATECIQGYRSASSMTKGMFFVGLALGAIAFALVVGSIAYLYFT